MTEKQREQALKNLAKGKATRFKAGEKQVEIARQGGYASQAVQHKKRNIDELTMKLIDKPLSDKQKAGLSGLFGDLEEDEATMSAVIVAGLIKAASKGSTEAFKQIKEIQERVEAKQENDAIYELPASVIGKDFVDINRNIRPNIAYVFEGGRGSLKSSFIGFKVIELLKNHPDLHACVTRQVGNTIKDSVFAQLKWCIHKLRLDDEFTIKNSPAEITYKKTGQKIYFRGLDDEKKLKSMKPDFGYIGILWKEEKDQMKGAEQERSVNQSVLRGGDITYDLSSYNPPKSKSNWVNKEKTVHNPNRVIHTSNYLDAPDEWLGEKFIQDAEHLRQVNPDAYENEYMGVANGDGGNVFDNIECRPITNEEIRTFDNIFQGVDWGISPDPFAFVRLHYDADSETIYFIDEIYERHLYNAESGQRLLDKKYDDFEIICDSAEKKSTKDFRDMGLPAKNALKGPGSIDYGMKWLRRRRLVIDPARTPNVYNEFAKYEYDRDKEDNIITGYPDKDNHTIDATRYALERYCNKRGTSA